MNDIEPGEIYRCVPMDPGGTASLVQQRSDPRWTFKLQELKRLQSLTAHCNRELIDGERIPTIDCQSRQSEIVA